MKDFKNLLSELRNDYGTDGDREGFVFTPNENETVIKAEWCVFEHDDDDEIIEVEPREEYPALYLTDEGVKMEKGGWHKINKLSEDQKSYFFYYMSGFGDRIETFTE